MAEIDFDPEDYLDEVSTDALIDELKTRNNFNPSKDFIIEAETINNSGIIDLNPDERFPIRYAIIKLLDLSVGASLKDIIEGIKENYYK